ncbi:small auxin-up RNA [Artemisia annua]|uniref:Small auxin-up RNA n=1 Tax=Artemisia annua TaxID=35608 RepID=A0A2U1PAM6_ARTAN|nr:small auxin-up RNA [Artemisia annua]
MNRWRRRCTTSCGGTLAVYIGPDHTRFIIPTRFLNLPVFITLLNKAEEEYGYQRNGGLVIPCDVIFFKKVVKVLERNEEGFKMFDLEDFVKMFDDVMCDEMKQCKEEHVKKLQIDLVFW